MLGKTAGGLYWMFRYLERSENASRLLEAGLRMSLTAARPSSDDWLSVLTTAGVHDTYFEHHDEAEADAVIDFVLRSEANPASVLGAVSAARQNARMVRTALTRELWEATNQCFLTIDEALAQPIPIAELPAVLSLVRQESALVRGSLFGTMMRNETFSFCRLGTFVERADNTARILDVKYYVLLPSALHVTSVLDNVQWETILRSLSAERGYRWANQGDVNSLGFAAFLILDERFPRSLAFCFAEIAENLDRLSGSHDPTTVRSPALAHQLRSSCRDRSIESIIDEGLHGYLRDRITEVNTLAVQIELDYRFTA